MLDDSEKKQVADALLMIAEERLRLSDSMSYFLQQTIRMRESVRQLELAYDRLGELLRPQTRESLEAKIAELKKLLEAATT